MSEARGYRFHPLERRGVVVGLQASQLATLATGVLLGLLILQASSGPAGLFEAVAVVGAGAATACWPVAGRTPVGWAPVAGGWLLRRRHPTRIGPPRTTTAPAGVSLMAAPAAPGEDPLGVVRDRRTGTWTAVLRVGSRAFTLLDPEDKQRRLAAWGAVLAGMARGGSPIHRIQWVERTVVGDGDALDAYLAEAGPSSPDERRLAAFDSYREVIAGAGPVTQGQEVLVAVTVHPRRAARGLRPFGRGPQGICALLRRELRLLQGQLRTSELQPGRPLDLPGLAAAVRVAIDPGARRRRAPSGDAGAWPAGLCDGWASVRADGRWHATYWVSEWPRLEVGPDFLSPLFLVEGVRTVAVTMAPVPPARAVREVEAARTADLADAELRRRAGFLSTARHQREAEGVLHREAELANGHAELRFSGYVSVSASTPAELDEATAAVEQAAQQAHLELRRLFGQQAEALTWTLPLGRGLA